MNLTLKPVVLRWARERAGLDAAALAKKAGLTVARVHGWEHSGELRFKQAEKLARATHTPFGYFKVSSLVLLRRLHDLKYLGWDDFLQRYRQETARFAQLAAKQAGGGDFYRTQRSRSGERFAKALIECTLEGRTPYRDAMRLLGISKMSTFNQFARELEFAA
jgi:transcriptional regulator with XRE-family HTH domain